MRYLDHQVLAPKYATLIKLEPSRSIAHLRSKHHDFRLVKMPATAADIPPELFDLILDSLNLNSYVSEDYQRQIAHVSKHDLNMATLVCRHWAKLCQTKLFEEVSLSSPEDVSQLLGLLKSTEGRVGNSIRSLYIPTSSLSDEAKTKPFLHLLPPLYPLIPASLKTSIVFDGPLNAKRGSFRSIHRTLPRTNPSFSTSLAHLHLNDLHLHNFNELMYAVGELPDMYRLVCTKVTWDTLPAVVPVRRVAPANVLEEVLASGCTDNWALVLLFVGYKRREALYLSQGDISTAGQLVKFVEAGIDRQQFARSEATICGVVTSDLISVSEYYTSPSLTIKLTVGCLYSCKLRLDVHRYRTRRRKIQRFRHCADTFVAHLVSSQYGYQSRRDICGYP